GWVVPSGAPLRVTTVHAHANIAQVRLVPQATHYVVKVVSERAPDPQPIDPSCIANVATGVNTLAAIPSIQPGFVPLLVHGRPPKNLNQFYNKRHAKLQARLPAVRFTFRALDELTDDWTRAIPSSLHTASQVIIDLLVFHGIGTLVSGKHEGWKQ